MHSTKGIFSIVIIRCPFTTGKIHKYIPVATTLKLEYFFLKRWTHVLFMEPLIHTHCFGRLLWVSKPK